MTRVDDELATAVDELVEAGAVASRSDAVRVALEQLVDRHRRRIVGKQITAGYEAVPQANADVDWCEHSPTADVTGVG